MIPRFQHHLGQGRHNLGLEASFFSFLLEIVEANCLDHLQFLSPKLWDSQIFKGE